MHALPLGAAPHAHGQRAQLGLTVAVALVLLFAAGCVRQPRNQESVKRGKTLYESCVACHGESGAGQESLQAPNISGLPGWYVQAQLSSFSKGHRGKHPSDVAGLRMYPMSRHIKTDEDRAAVGAHVAALPKHTASPTLTGGDASKGKALFATCAACHGGSGAGNKGLGAPPLGQNHDWYLLAQLKKFKSGVRGYDPADTKGVLMTASVKVLEDEQAMLDVVAYIKTLGN